jgi:hypothetical protein
MRVPSEQVGGMLRAAKMGVPAPSKLVAQALQDLLDERQALRDALEVISHAERLGYGGFPELRAKLDALRARPATPSPVERGLSDSARGGDEKNRRT